MLARRRLALDLTALALGASACRPTAHEVTRAASPPDAAALTSSVLGQLSYPTDVLPDGRVQLRDGDWEADSSSLDGASVHLATIAHGELSGDTHRDAVVILITNAGGTGRFLDLIPVLSTAGRPHVGRATPLGDRVLPESLWVAGGRAHLRIVTHDSTDGLCCPTRRELQLYRLVRDSLVLERSELLGRLPPEPRE